MNFVKVWKETVTFALDELTVLEIFLIKKEMKTAEIWCSTCWKWYIFMYTVSFIDKFKILLHLVLKTISVITIMICDCPTTWKVSKYGTFSGPYFPVFRLNSEIYSINLRIHSEYAKKRTRKLRILTLFTQWHFSYSALYCLENWKWVLIKK